MIGAKVMNIKVKLCMLLKSKFRNIAMYRTIKGNVKIDRYTMSCLSNFLLGLIKKRCPTKTRVAKAITPKYSPFEKMGKNSSLFLEPR